MSLVCHSKSTADEQIADYLGIDVKNVTSLRGLYDGQFSQKSEADLLRKLGVYRSPNYTRKSNNGKYVNTAFDLMLDSERKKPVAERRKFTIIKDVEDNQYSIHFKTGPKKSYNPLSKNNLTESEKQRLFKAAAIVIPEGAILSTHGEVSNGGFAGLERFENLGFDVEKDSEGNPLTRPQTINDEEIVDARRIPVYRKRYNNTLLTPEQESRELTKEEVVELADKLQKFKYEMVHTSIMKIKTGTDRTARSLQKSLVEAYKDSLQREDRINLVVKQFTVFLDKFEKAFGISREQALRGVVVDGKKIGGEYAVIEALYNMFLVTANKNALKAELAKSKGDTKAQLEFEHRSREYAKMLYNWSALMSAARSRILYTEGIILGNKVAYIANATVDNFGENNLEELFDAYESKRDGYHELNDRTSAFSKLGNDVRRALSDVPKLKYVKNGSKVEIFLDKDDLGQIRTESPISTHQNLMMIFRGIQNEADMLNKLSKAIKSKSNIQYKVILDSLKANPQLRTAFYIDFSKETVPYAKTLPQKGNSIWSKTQVLNKPDDYIYKKFKADVSNGIINTYVSETSVLKDSMAAGSTITEEAATEFLFKALKLYVLVTKLPEMSDDIATQAFAYIQSEIPEILGLLNFDVYDSKNIGYKTVLDAFSTYNEVRDLRNTLDDILQYSKLIPRGTINYSNLVQYVLNNFESLYSVQDGILKDNKTALNTLKEKCKFTPNLSFKQMLASNVGKTSYKAEQSIEKIASKLETASDRDYEAFARFVDANGKKVAYYSDVNRSYMGHYLNLITEYAKEDNKEGILQLLEDKFFKSGYFCRRENGKIVEIYNQWLKELYEVCKSKVSLSDTWIAKNQLFLRTLGNSELNFENFTSIQHFQDILSYYYSDTGINSSANTALYPIFVLGDSGVAKYIRAKRYTEKEIIDQFYNVYLQDIKTYTTRKAIQDVLNRTHMTQIENYTSSIDEKADYLKYMSDTDKEELFSEDNNGIITPVSQEVFTEKITKYLEDEFAKFKDNISKLGALTETVTEKGDTIYPSLDHYYQAEKKRLGNKDLTIDDLLRDFFYNTKFAYIQQFQIFTISPSFYENTKILQKRYKEEHAPGLELSLQAIDIYNNTYYAKTDAEGNLITHQTVKYFDDISVDSEEVDSYFIDAIAYHFGLIELEYKGKDITNVSYDEAVKVGKNNKVYNLYKKCTLTDGQGYRSLTSYRRIMGMSRQWSPDMEAAYNEIQNLRASLSTLSDSEKKNALDRIKKLNVIFQPLKPFLYTYEAFDLGESNNNEVAPIPVQHKYAEIVLIPELLPEGSKLRAIAEYMENPENDVDMVCSTKCVKVGAFGSTVLDYKINSEGLYIDKNGNVLPDKNGNIPKSRSSQIKEGRVPTTAEDISAQLNDQCAYKHKLDLRDYRIQTNVPEHINSSQLFGTQIRKLIMAGIQIGKDYSHYFKKFFPQEMPKDFTIQIIDGEERHINGANLLAFYNGLIIANILDSLDSFEQALKSNTDISDVLIQSVMANLRESQDNIFAYELAIEEGVDEEEASNKFLVPLFEGSLAHDSQATLLSIFKKVVNKQSIKGGSAVQASAMGITRVEEATNNDDTGLRYVTNAEINGGKATNILYAEVELSWDLSITDENGKTINLNMSDWCNEDGTLKLSNEVLDKSDPRYVDYMSYKDENGQVRIPLIEQSFPNILSMVAYRIPTEREYSMINCRIKRFTPKMNGGIIKVPSQGTVIAGFDFDIDKLYFMRYELERDSASYNKDYMNHLKEKFGDMPDNYLLWSEFFTINTNVADDLSRLQKEYKDYIKDLKDTYKEYINRDSLDLINSMTEEEFIKDRLSNSKFNDIPNNGKHLIDFWKLSDVVEEQFGSKSREEVFNEFVEENKIKSYAWKQYDFSKGVLTQTKASRNNMLLHIIQSRLMDEETFKGRYTPGGFPETSNAARLHREILFNDKVYSLNDLNKIDLSNTLDPEPNYDPTDIMTQIIYNQLNQVAGKLIGIFANQNTNHGISRLMKRFELKEGIGFASKVDTPLSDLIHAPKGIDIELSMAEFLAAVVDAVKDPTVNYLNINTLNAEAAALLARLGYSKFEIGLLFNQPIVKAICDYAYNQDLTLQAAANELKRQYFGKKGNIIKDSEVIDLKLDTETLVAEEAAGAKNNNYSIEGNKVQLAVLNLFIDIAKKASYLGQFNSTTKFTASNAVSSSHGGMLAQQVKVSNFKKNFSRNEFGDIVINDEFPFNIELAKNNKGQDVLPIDDNSKLNDLLASHDYIGYLSEIIANPFGYEQAMFDANRRALSIFDKQYPYRSRYYEAVREKLLSLTKMNYFPGEIFDDIHRDILVQAFNEDTENLLCGTRKINGINAIDFYREQFPIIMRNFLEEYKEVNYPKLYEALPILNSVYPTTYTDKKTNLDKDVLKVKLSRMQASQKDSIKRSWLDLFDSEGIIDMMKSEYQFSEEQADNFKNELTFIGQSLFAYAFFTSGFTITPFSLMNLVPSELKSRMIVKRIPKVGINGEIIENQYDDITYTEFLYQHQQDVDSGKGLFRVNDFARKYILNHLDYKYFVYDLTKLPKTETDAVGSIVRHGIKVDNNRLQVAIDLSKEDKILYNRLVIKPVISTEGNAEALMFRPVLRYNNEYYMADSVSNHGFNSGDIVGNIARITYRKVSSLGKTNVSVNYSTSISEMMDVYDQASSEDKEIADAIAQYNNDEVGVENTPIVSANSVSLDNSILNAFEIMYNGGKLTNVIKTEDFC